MDEGENRPCRFERPVSGVRRIFVKRTKFFSMALDSIHKSFQTALKMANISNFRFHDLRHTVATRLVEKGVPIPVVQEILGHSKIETTMRYAHTIPNQCKTTVSLRILNREFDICYQKIEMRVTMYYNVINCNTRRYI